MSSTYVGRFAPSPTGPLHYGSLVAAVASYLDARHHEGRWLLRIEDLDPPRESPDAPAIIKHQLRAFGLNWDDTETYQSQHLKDYSAALDTLSHQDLIFYCQCSRKSTPPIYPGTCRAQHHRPKNTASAVRLLVPDLEMRIIDLNLGGFRWNLQKEVGDFIIQRKDLLFAYQLAVVVDDIRQSVNHIVRGIDLLDSTPKQLAIYHYLHEMPPTYLHIPVIIGADGNKLSKQAHAKAISETGRLETLQCVLKDLGQSGFIAGRNIEETLRLAVTHWKRQDVPKKSQLPLRHELY